MNALTVTGLSGPQHPPKVDGLGGNETKEIISMRAGLSRPAHPPKVSGEPIIKTEIITDITCKFKGKLIAMEVKVDPGSETNCIPLSHFRHLFPQL